MARFVFELEAVLEQRRAEERAAQLKVATLERQRLDLEERIREMQRGAAREKGDLRAHASGSGGTALIDMRVLRMQAGASLRLLARAQQAAIQLAGVLARLEGARGELLAATTRRKAVETLRERRLAAWREDMNRRETAALDELQVMGAARREDQL